MIVTDEKNERQELNKILPSLEDYINAKENFKNHTISQDEVNAVVEKLIVQINEFLTLIYSYSTSKDEANAILTNIRIKK